MNSGRAILISETPALFTAISSKFSRADSRRVAYVFGDMDLDISGGHRAGPEETRAQAVEKRKRSIARMLGLETVQQVFILGDESSATGGDVENLVIADVLSSLLVTRKRCNPVKWFKDFPIPVFVKMDRIPSFDIAKRMDFKLITPGVERSRKIEDVKTYFKPFSTEEGWARALWGSPFPSRPQMPVCKLDFRKMGREDYVHVVVGPFNSMAEALIVEAIRICHYPVGKPTRITIVDDAFDRGSTALQKLQARRPMISSLVDVVVDQLTGDFSSPHVRQMLDAEAQNKHCLLSIAVCTEDSDESEGTKTNETAATTYLYGRADALGKTSSAFTSDSPNDGLPFPFDNGATRGTMGLETRSLTVTQAAGDGLLQLYVEAMADEGNRLGVTVEGATTLTVTPLGRFWSDSQAGKLRKMLWTIPVRRDDKVTLLKEGAAMKYAARLIPFGASQQLEDVEKK